MLENNMLPDVNNLGPSGVAEIHNKSFVHAKR